MRVFTETQRFDQWWFRLLMVIVIGVTIFPLVLSYSELKEDGTSLLIVGLACGISLLLVILILFYFKLETRIDEAGIHYSFWPFHLSTRHINWQDMNACYVREYSPIAEYGGWGYRIRLGKGGRALNIKGNKGIQIELSTGKKMLIGTQKEAEARSVISQYQHKLAKS